MKEKHDIADAQSEEPDDNGDSELEELLARKFSSLRLFVEKDDSSASHAIASARDKLENYKRWQKSGVPIRGVVVRLADGEEMDIITRSQHMLAATCFVKNLLPGAVLNVYRKADKYFGEVLLYTVEVSEIPPGGFSFSKSYPTKQTLSLQIQHGQECQLNISVNYTPAPEFERHTYSDRLRRIPLLGPALLALGGAIYLLCRRIWRNEKGESQPGWTAVTAVVTSVFLLGAASLYWSKPSADSVAPVRAKQTTPTASTPAPQNQIAQSAAEGTQPPFMHTGPKADTPALNNQSSGAAVAPPASQDVVSDAGATCAAPPSRATTNVASNATVAPAATETRKNTTGGSGNTNAPPAAVMAHQPIGIYVKAFAKNDKNLEAALLDTFVKELEKTARFKVWTDEPGKQVPKGIYEVSVYYSPVEGCHGRIWATLYDVNSTEMEFWIKNCRKYPKSRMLALTSQEVVKEIVPLVLTDATAKKSTGS